MGLVGCAKTSVSYQSVLCKKPEDWRPRCCHLFTLYCCSQICRFPVSCLGSPRFIY